MIHRLTRFALWVTLIGLSPALAQAEGTLSSTPGKSVVVGPATAGPNADTLSGDVAPAVPMQLYVEGPNPDRFYPAFLSPEGEKQAKAHALYAEALRSELRSGFVTALPLYIAITKLDPHFIQAHLKIALYYFQQNQVDKALTYLKFGLTNNPDSAELKAATAYAYRLLKRNDEALALAREVLAEAPDQVTAYRVIFEIYTEQGKFDEAMKMVETTVKQNTGKASFWINLAKLYQDLLDEEQRQSANAASSTGKEHAQKVARQLLPLYEKALACGEPSTELLMFLSDTHEALDEIDKALEYAKMAHEDSPQNVEILLRLATLEFTSGHREDAVSYYEEAYNLAPDYGSGWLGNTLAKIYAGLGQTPKAIDVLEQMIARAPTQVYLYNDLAELYERADQLDKAEFNFQQALFLDSGTPLPYLHLALTQIREKKFALADHTLADGLTKFPLSARLYWLQAVELREQKKYDAALESYAQVKTLATDADAGLIKEDYYIELSLTQELANKKELIEPTLREGLRKFPDSANLLNTLAYFWAEQGTNLEEALKMSKKSLELEPTSGAFLDTLGWIYCRLDQPKEALPLLEQAVTQTKEDPVVTGHLADVYVKLGRMSDAVELWQKIVLADPDNKDVRSKLDAAKAEASNIKLRPFKKP